ncbi:TolB family protein [Candidatus Auribacterota bacterium]
MKTKNRLSIISITILFVLILQVSLPAEAFFWKEYSNYIYYHCADWGPDLENPDEEKNYFVKQIIFYEEKRWIGNEVYFCSMNPDGSEKKEIVKLFEDTELYLDINGNTSFMDICAKKRKAAIAFSAGDWPQVGLWTINLDGTDFRRIVEMKWTKDFQYRVNHPSWLLEGEQLIYEEKWLHEVKDSEFYIVKVDKDGKNKVYLTSKEDGGDKNRFPSVSPDEKKIAYTHFRTEIKKGGRDLWVMDIDGKNKKLLYENERHYADYPEWSPDGRKLYVVYVSNFAVVDAATGKQEINELLKFDGKYWIPRKMHWSNKYGYLLDGAGSIGLIRNDLSYYVPQKQVGGGYVKTKNRRDLSKYNYKWGN